jgi:acyl-coenzyme A synthetase/AMP-(fatty) acid ligase
MPPLTRGLAAATAAVREVKIGRGHVAVQFVDSVPITASGKVMRRLLKDYDDGTR